MLLMVARGQNFVDGFEQTGIAQFENRQNLGVLPDQNAVFANEKVGSADTQKTFGPISFHHLQILIAQQTKWNSALSRKAAMFVDRVAANSKESQVASLKQMIVITKRMNFGRANGSEIARIEEN